MKSEYDKKSSKIREMVALPPDMLGNQLAKAHTDMADVAPSFVPHVTDIAQKGLNFLHLKMPKPNAEFMGDHDWEPSKSQQARWLHYHDAVNNPIGALDHVKNGTLSNQHMEALSAVHPEVLADMRQKVMENMTQKNMKNLPYSTKIAVSKFLGQPMHESLMPKVILADQMNYAQPAGQAALGAPQRKGSTQGGLAKLNTAKMAATETQELEQEKV